MLFEQHILYTQPPPATLPSTWILCYWTNWVWLADVLGFLKTIFMLCDLLEGLTGLRRPVHTVIVYYSEEEKTLMRGKIEGRRRREDRGWDGWIPSLTQWIRIWANSGRWWKTGKLGMLQSIGLQRATEQQKQHSEEAQVNISREKGLRGQSPGETKAQASSCPLPMKSHTQCLILSVTMCDDPC